MDRREFLASSLAASAVAAMAPRGTLEAAPQSAGASGGREFYELRRYHLNSGPQRTLCNDFFRDALIPALNRMRISPVGVFDLSIGPETPSIYVLMPAQTADALLMAESRLAQGP